jgi:hypothetical protein
MSAENSEFGKWFKAQAGKPIMSESEYCTLRDETIPSLQKKLDDALSNLKEMERYQTARQFALYAWTSKPNEKE